MCSNSNILEAEDGCLAETCETTNEIKNILKGTIISIDIYSNSQKMSSMWPWEDSLGLDSGYKWATLTYLQLNKKAYNGCLILISTNYKNKPII